MEIVIFGVVVFALAAYWIWRVRRGGSVDDPDRVRQGLPDDLREKNVAPSGIKEIYRDIRPQPRVSREEGHGKDGGG